MKNKYLFYLIILILFAGNSCKIEQQKSVDQKLFRLHSAESTGINFSNKLTETPELNAFVFNYMYNGAGVGVADFNNDGLQDIYFVGNQVSDRLYLNKGELQFEDISTSSGIEGFGGWKNGISIVDINNDGYLDIYITRGGKTDDPRLNSNLLFINQKNLTFKEEARYYKIDDTGFSIASSFFDYDNDGDLDLYVTNRPNKWPVTDDEIIQVKKDQSLGKINFKETDRLYRNNGDLSFTDVSVESGIIPNYGYGLSVCTGDVNNDGWNDIYVANDFAENDYFFLNFGGGKFRQSAQDLTNHVSFFSMGSDFGDINNDGQEEIVVVEMRPEDYKRSKTSMPAMQPAFFEKLKREGFAHQYMHNVLQYNFGNGFFGDISQLSGIDKTDWSWSALLSDLDNDGFKDLFVTNGFKRDVYDRDAQPLLAEFMKKNKIDQFQQGLKLLPEVKLVNYAFKNNGDLTFRKSMHEWGIDIPSYSNGAATADLDNDGDLDLVINNIDDPAFLYENTNNEKNNFLRIKLEGPENNRFGYGAKVKLHLGSDILYQQLQVSRGYLSSCEPIVHFGLGSRKKIDKLEVSWADGKTNILTNVSVNQLLVIKYSEAAQNNTLPEQSAQPIFAEATQEFIRPPFFHSENPFDDYETQQLLPHRLSRIGPTIAVADINGDGLQDFYCGNAHGQPGALYIQKSDHHFDLLPNDDFFADRDFEDIGALFFDADKDGDQDLYVVSGGTEVEQGSPFYQDRLYLNKGNGKFTKTIDALPAIITSGSCVTAADFDGDGDLDIFRGGRTIPDKYPFAPKSYLLENDGTGKFKDVIAEKAPQLEFIGMVTSAVWENIKGDQKAELIVVGEWMPVSIFENENGILKKADPQSTNTQFSEGWWNKIQAVDLDQDGDKDFILGNLGLNYKFHANKEKPFHVFCDDYDGSGTYEIVLAKLDGKDLVPVRGRQCSSEQMPSIASKFKDYNSFANADLDGIYGEKLKNSLHYQAYQFQSMILKNNNGQFEFIPLPMESQFSTIQGIAVEDFDGDGIRDLAIAGNMFNSEIETTRADASIGLILKGTKDAFRFEPLTVKNSGVFLPFDVKDLQMIKTGSTFSLLVACNDSPLLFLKNQLSLRSK